MAFNKIKEIYGLGMVSDGVVHFKELDKNTTETKTHSSVGLHGNRNRFRFINGKVEWTDTPEKDATIRVEDYLYRHRYPFIKHSHYFSSAEIDINNLSENIQKIVKPSVPESKEGRFWWLSPDGKFYPVMFQYHEAWAKQYLIKDVGMSEEQFTDTPYKILKGMGWMRVGIMWNDYMEDSVMEFDYDQTKSPTPNYKLVKIINDFAIEKGIKYIKDTYKRPMEVFENAKISKSEFKKLIKEIVKEINKSTLYGREDYIGGIVDGEVRAEPVKTGKVMSYLHGDFPGLYSGQNSTNWRYSKNKNKVTWNITPTQESIEKVNEFLLKRGIKNPIHRSIYNESLYYELNESTIEPRWKAWWMEPSGTLHRVYNPEDPTSGHWNWAKNFLSKSGIKLSSNESPTLHLFKKGWIRLAFDYYADDVLHFDFDKINRPTEKTLGHIKNLAVELNANGLMNDNTNTTVELLQESSFFKKLLNWKYVPGKFYWMDNNGGLIPVKQQHHIETALNILKNKFGIDLDKIDVNDEISNEIYKMMYNKNFILIRITDGNMEINYGDIQNISRVQKDGLRDLAIENQIDRIFDSNSGLYLPVN